MPDPQTFLVPFSDVEAEPGGWRALSDEPWLEITPAKPFAGRWLRLAWESSFAEIPCRPVLRIESPAGRRDILPGGAGLGRQHWIGAIPSGTTRLLVSPAPRAGPFRWRLAAADVLSTLDVFRQAWRSSAARAALGLADACIGLRRHADINFAISLRDPPLSAYGEWRTRRLRPLEPEGFDRPPPGAAAVHVRVLAAPADADRIRSDLERQPHPSWSLRAAGGGPAEEVGDLPDDALVTVAPEGGRLPPWALLAVAAAAVARPDADVLYGDVELSGPDGAIAACRFRPGPDPLLAAAGLLEGPGVFWRVGRLRGPAADASPVRAAALFRPLAIAPGDATRQAFAAPPADALAAPMPETTIIVPTRDRLALLQACVESILQKTADPFRLLIIDNDSGNPATLDYLRQLQERGHAEVHRVPGPFNFSHLCNEGARLAPSPYVAFLNNDTTILDPRWLARLLIHAALPDVGAVGAKLLYPSGAVQHAGVVVGMHGLAGHAEAGAARDEEGVFGRLGAPHQVSAVTGACLLIHRGRFLAAGGFDAEGFPIELNDIDLCLRLAAGGRRNILAGDCVLIHHESASRGRAAEDAYPRERALFRERWAQVMQNDPHFHPALSLNEVAPRLG